MKFDWRRLFCGPWIQNCPTDWQWDELLSAALDKHRPVKVSNHTAAIGPLVVWVSNWPYAYGSPYAPREINILPSVATRHRLRNMLHEDDMESLRGEEA